VIARQIVHHAGFGLGLDSPRFPFHNFALNIYHLINSINVLVALFAFTVAIVGICANEQIGVHLFRALLAYYEP
jgi:hypothetical protein